MFLSESVVDCDVKGRRSSPGQGLRSSSTLHVFKLGVSICSCHRAVITDRMATGYFHNPSQWELPVVQKGQVFLWHAGFHERGSKTSALGISSGIQTAHDGLVKRAVC